jgi:D-3-phosphoglycerate dehydrogenase
MVGQITTILAKGGINITDLINHHHNDYAYNIIDTDQPVPQEQLEQLIDIDGVVRVRVLEQ